MSWTFRRLAVFLVPVALAGCSSVLGRNRPAPPLADVPATRATLTHVRQVAGNVFELADWNTVVQLDYSELRSSRGEEAFERHTQALERDQAGYLCGGAATYLSEALDREGYRTLTYNSGSGPFTHVLTLVEASDRLYVFDSYSGAVAEEDNRYLPFSVLLRTLIEPNPIPSGDLFESLDRGLRKEYIRQLDPGVDWSAVSDDALTRVLGFGDMRATTARRNDDGSIEAWLGRPDIGFTTCHISRSATMNCLLPPHKEDVYASLDAGLAMRTGVAGALLLMPLGLDSEDRAAFLSKYPYLRVLDAYVPRFNEADTLTPPNRQAYRDLVASLKADLSVALAATGTMPVRQAP